MGENTRNPTSIWVPTIDLQPAVSAARAAGLKELLSARGEELQDAVAMVTELVGRSVDRAQEAREWTLDTVQASVGISFAAESGVIIAKVAAEASFTLTLNFTRESAAVIPPAELA